MFLASHFAVFSTVSNSTLRMTIQINPQQPSLGAMNFFRFWGILLYASGVIADLPIHCVLSQVTGLWEFRSWKDPVVSPRSCSDDLADLAELSAPTFVHLSSAKVDETDRINSDAGLTNRVQSSPGGGWGVVADEGMVVRVGNRDSTVFYGQFKYSVDPSVDSSQRVKYTLPDGRTPGYISNCNALSRGWALVGSGEKRTVFCLIGRRVDHSGPELRGSIISPHTRTLMPRHWSESHYPVEFQVTPYIKPRQYDIQPKSCGSCFVLTFAFAFERILSHKLSTLGVGDTPPMRMDTEFMLQSSFSSRGCDGGYYESLILDLTVTGIRLCDNAGADSACNPSSALVFPRGFVQLQTEAEVKQSLVSNGPVLVGLFLEPKIFGNFNSETVYEVPRSTHTEEWDYINHGVVITGWGVDEAGTKFWSTFNPWGYEARLRRGDSHDWYLKYAVAILPDLCRGYAFEQIESHVVDARRILKCD